MTPEEIKQYLQMKYEANAKKCKSLHLQVEMIEAEVKYHKSKFDVHKTQPLELKLIRVKGELNSLWNKQVDLYHDIHK